MKTKIKSSTSQKDSQKDTKTHSYAGYTITWLAFAIFLSLAQSSCLKTRAQIRDEQAYPAGGEASGESGNTDQNASGGTPGAAPASGQYAVDELKSEFIHLVGRVDELERSTRQQVTDSTDGKQGLATHETRLKELEGRIAELEQAQAQLIENVKRLEDSSARVNKAEAGSLLDKGRKELNAGDAGGAAETLSVYIKAMGDKTPEEAYYLRGDAYFKTKEYKKAILDYSKFPEKFNKSHRMPHALFQIGSSFELMGMAEDSKTFFQELVDKFPKSPDAHKAKSRLAGKK